MARVHQKEARVETACPVGRCNCPCDELHVRKVGRYVLIIVGLPLLVFGLKWLTDLFANDEARFFKCFANSGKGKAAGLVGAWCATHTVQKTTFYRFSEAGMDLHAGICRIQATTGKDKFVWHELMRCGALSHQDFGPVVIMPDDNQRGGFFGANCGGFVSPVFLAAGFFWVKGALINFFGIGHFLSRTQAKGAAWGHASGLNLPVAGEDVQ